MMVPLAAALVAVVTANPPVTSAKAALQKFNPLVGEWKGTGTPEGTPDERKAGFWTETVTWSWRFKGPDAWLVAEIQNSKQFTSGELRYDPDAERYILALTTPAKSVQTYTGKLSADAKSPTLTLERTDGKVAERFVLTLLHENRYLYRLEAKPAGAVVFAKRYQVGSTKQGVPFATAVKGPECVVSGGLAKMTVKYKGKDYPVCCSGCRDAFLDDPEKFIKAATEGK